MLILRRITGEKAEINTVIGNGYILVNSLSNKDDYEKLLKEWKALADDIYGFVIYNNGVSIMPLYKKSYYFMMTENGATFANLTFK